MVLKTTFENLIGHYSNDELLIKRLWNEIAKRHSVPERHYHTLSHLQKLIEELQEYKNIITDWHTMLFSIFYHDIVYKIMKHDNEEKSAAFALNQLGTIDFPIQRATACSKQILATKTHAISDDADTNLFTDADLTVLGQPRDQYEIYCIQIRREYGVYPDLLYKPGRKKVISHFLLMKSIFKTTGFYDKYEKQARENLQWELGKLGSR